MPEKEGPQNSILVRPLDTPFTVDGAVFNVARTRQALWALQIRRRPPRPGALVGHARGPDAQHQPAGLLSARARLPAAHRNRDRDRPRYGEVPSDVAAARGRQAIGKRSSVHLGFQVPSAQPGLTLEFDPGPRAPRIRVPLD